MVWTPEVGDIVEFEMVNDTGGHIPRWFYDHDMSRSLTCYGSLGTSTGKITRVDDAPGGFKLKGPSFEIEYARPKGQVWKWDWPMPTHSLWDDTRPGWIKLVRKHYVQALTGQPSPVTFNMDEIRPKGKPLTKAAKCECGAVATWGAMAPHSNWCPLFEKSV